MSSAQTSSNIGQVMESGFRSPAERGNDFNPISNPDEMLGHVSLAVLSNNAAVPSGCVCEGNRPCTTNTIGCPAGNPIPELNKALEQVLQLEFQASQATSASDQRIFSGMAKSIVKEMYWRWHQTMPLARFTGRICGGPCEDGCITKISSLGGKVNIRNHEELLMLKAIQYEIHDAYPTPKRLKLEDKRVAIIGAGPAGLAAAKALNTICEVDVYEQKPFAGGLLATGIPSFKLEPEIVREEIEIIECEGVNFHLNQKIDAARLKQMISDYDAVIFAVGAGKPRILTNEQCPGISATGVLYWDQFLENQKLSDFAPEIHDPSLTVKDQNVVIYGYGATAEDVISTCLKQGAKSVRVIYRGIASAIDAGLDTWEARRDQSLGVHGRYGTEEGHAANDVGRLFKVHHQKVLSRIIENEAGNVVGVEVARVNAGKLPSDAAVRYEADRVIIAIGPMGPRFEGANELGLETDKSGALVTEGNFLRAKGSRNIFIAGDCRAIPRDMQNHSSAQKLVVTAIANGLDAAAGVRSLFTGNAKSAKEQPFIPFIPEEDLPG